MHNLSDWSEIAIVKTLPDENAPTQPTNLRIKNRNDSSITITWNASEDNSEVKDYDVYRNDILIGTVSGTSFTDSIPCKDNFRLKTITVESALEGTESRKQMYNAELSKNAEIVKFDLDMSDMEDGIYNVRVKVTDAAGPDSDYYTCSYDFKHCTIPAPKLTAEEKGWHIKLDWSETDDSSLLGYNIYKCSYNSKSFVLVGRTTLNSYTDNNVVAEQPYFYYVEAVDEYNNVVASDKIMAVPTGEDLIAPVADCGIDTYGISENSISFDGTTSDVAAPKHTYDEPGEYSASLTVTDSSKGTAISGALAYMTTDFLLNKTKELRICN